MNSLLFLIPLSILLLVGAGIALFWAIDHGQFDDMEAGSLLPVVDADRAPTEAAAGESVESAADETRGIKLMNAVNRGRPGDSR